MQAQVKTMPEFNVAYVRKTGPYGKETCTAAFEELFSWCQPRGYCQQGPVLALYWDDPQSIPPEKCRTDACVAVPEGIETEGAVQCQKIAAGNYAVCSFELTIEQFPAAWQEAFSWVIANNLRTLEKPCYEFYHNDGTKEPGGIWKVDICIPVAG